MDRGRPSRARPSLRQALQQMRYMMYGRGLSLTQSLSVCLCYSMALG
jgi:hypothetical protein